ncbi:MAG: deoxyguanosinetriphosphate triphosphohydrolase [Candidatus Omnitrophota bacterium]|nr:deoxyguanosinetriphosphate triphosphohydrolase [Candidatus Omnitrophota bacterium]
MLKRRDIEKKEELLASYAQKSKFTKGRRYKEAEHDYRSSYQRDRDRIIYSTAFRRLEYKTQVFVNHEGDYYRTRLTHTLEVSQIAGSIARALCLNEDLVEAISLAHDLGHTPFGHSGEDALHEIMRDHGGFDHNSQGLRVVDYLEERYPDFPGLNLTYEVREGIIKHSTPFDRPRPLIPFESKGSPLLEIQAVDIADEIAYDNHDLDDGITSGLLKEDDLREVSLWAAKEKEIKTRYPHIKGEIRKYQIIRALINEQVTDVLCQTEANIKKFKIQRPQDVVKIPERIVTVSKRIQALRQPMRDFLTQNLYQHYRVVRMSNKACRFITSLFNVYLDKPEQLPPTAQGRLKGEDKCRVICDYIAGMTDRYALDEYKKFFEPYERV